LATIADVRRRPHERRDPWWLEPLVIVSVLGGFVIYSLIVSVQNANYFFDPYLSPFYSPCLTTGCIHPTFPIIGSWYTLSPIWLTRRVTSMPIRRAATAWTAGTRRCRHGEAAVLSWIDRGLPPDLFSGAR